MKRVIVPMTAIAAFVLSASSFANDNDAALSAQVKKLSVQTKKLEREVASLKKHKKSVHKGHNVYKKAADSEKPWNHFVTVTTTPFLNKKTAFDGSDLLYNLSSMNEDLRLLEQKKDLVNDMAAQGYSLDRPILQLSGSVQGQLTSIGGFGTKATDGMNLSTAELDMNAIASDWATAFMSMDFNGSPTSTGNRAPNSTIYLGRGFVTLGNLNKYPVYFSGGLMYAPFGRYSNGMVSTPLTLSMGKIRTPMALLGFSLDNGLFGSVYGYSGSQTSGSSDVFKQAGVNAGFKNTFGSKGHYSVGAGWVSNIADSEGQQNTGLGVSAGKFSGFAVQQTGQSSSNNDLVHRVGAIDGHGQVVYGRVSLIGEYLGAVRRYSTNDLTYNAVGGVAKGAEPQAMHAEIDYMLPFVAKKYGTSVGFAYGHTWQALALNLPENSYTTFLNTSIWRETTESLEYRHDTDYTTSVTGTGRGATSAITGTGKGRNSVIAEFGVYF